MTYITKHTNNDKKREKVSQMSSFTHTVGEDNTPIYNGIFNTLIYIRVFNTPKYNIQLVISKLTRSLYCFMVCLCLRVPIKNIGFSCFI